MLKILDWLELHPGATWQQRWDACGAETDQTADWRDQMLASLQAAGNYGPWAGELRRRLGTGLAQLIGGDVIRPGLPWLLTTTFPARVAAEMGRVRDPAGITGLKALRETAGTGHATFDPDVERIGLIMAAKGGLVADIIPGDCIDLLDCCLTVFTRRPHHNNQHSSFFYQLLHTAGAFPPSAPATVRMISTKFAGPLTPEQMIARYDLACQPVRDLIIDYLRERQPGIDYSSLNQLAGTLGLRPWKDLEIHHPGISSLHLPADVAAAWKQRLQVRTVRTPDGGEQLIARESADDVLMIIRGFYLDLAQWALDDPARWGAWAVPCPIRGSDIQYKKQVRRTKARMDARTRERLPALPALIAAADRNRKDAAARLAAARATAPGETFTAGGQQLRPGRPGPPVPPDLGRGTRRRGAAGPDPRGRPRVLGLGRHRGPQPHRHPRRGTHRAVAPQPGPVPPARHRRARPPAGHRPVQDRRRTAPRHQPRARRRPVRDHHPDPPPRRDRPARRRLRHPRAHLEPAHAPAVPAARRPGGPAHHHRHHPRPPHQRARRAGITGTDGKPLIFKPHDFRRIFTTDAILNGMPPHIAQLILGHHDINTTMGYKAVYPQEAISGHRAFIARRRQLRPSEEYRSPTDTEWDEFLGHFEHRKLALGDCGRAYATSCIHEHSCIRCPMLRIDPAQRHRLEEIRDNLQARINEAEREGWTGEAEGLKVSLDAANNKIAQADLTAARRAEPSTSASPPTATSPPPSPPRETTMTTDDLTTALRACAAGLLPLEAGVALLISNGTFLHRNDFTSRFIQHGTRLRHSHGRDRLGRGHHRTPSRRTTLLRRRTAHPPASSQRSPQASPSISATPSLASTTTTQIFWSTQSGMQSASERFSPASYLFLSKYPKQGFPLPGRRN